MAREQPTNSMRQSFPADEISLVDVYLVYHRHKRAFWNVFLFFVLGGVVFAHLIPRKYAYTSVVEIGTRLLGDHVEPIESPESVAVKLKSSYVPQALRSYYKQHPNDKRIYRVDVTAPGNTSLVRLISKGGKSQGTAFEFVHSRAVMLLEQDESGIFSVLKQRLETKRTTEINHLAGLKAQEQQLEANLDHLTVMQSNALENAEQNVALDKAELARLKRVQKNKIADLRAESVVLQGERKNLGHSATLIGKEIVKYQSLVRDAEGQMSSANAEATDATRAMTLLMLSNEIQQARNSLADLENTLIVDIPDRRESLGSKIDDNERAQQNLKRSQADALEKLANALHEKERIVDDLRVTQGAQRESLRSQIAASVRHQADAKAAIAGTRVALEGLRETRSVAVSNRSLSPVGMSHALMAAIAAGLGVMCGMLAVGVSEVRTHVRERLALAYTGASPVVQASLAVAMRVGRERSGNQQASHSRGQSELRSEVGNG